MKVTPFGQRALVVDVDDLRQVHGLWRALRNRPPSGAEEIIAGSTSILVILDSSVELSSARDEIARTVPTDFVPRATKVVEIPVVYGGPDTEFVCASAGTTPLGLAAKHSEREYTVAFLGFSPGFGYLVGGDPGLRVPRLESPRSSVPAGSVALASEFTAVYPQSTPGGWRIIGRTDLTVFDPRRAEPSALAPGDSVRFVPVPELGQATSWEPVPLQESGAGEYVQVVEAGPLTTIQDTGRIGWGHLGVPRAGAADRRSAALANRLVGNEPHEPLLEATLSGPSLRLGCDRVIAVTGARAPITVDGIPARADTALHVRAGSEIEISRADSGARCYVSFSGGLAVDPVLGSRSTDTLSGLGPPRVRSGDAIPLGIARGDERERPDLQRTPVHRAGDVLTVTALRGPRDEWIGESGMEILASSVFEVATTSDRTGVRLDGARVNVLRREELPPEGMVPGAIQVPPGGAPIVLMRNHPTTGGYPVAAVVTDDGVDALAQARPGVRVRFDIR